MATCPRPSLPRQRDPSGECGPLRRVALLYGWNNSLSTLRSQGRKHLASIKLSDVCPLQESSTAAETTG